jgi:hypothetical protein
MIKIARDFKRYQLKNTAAGQYRRHINRAQYGTLLTGAEIFKMAQSPELSDVGLTSVLGTFTLANLKLAFKNLKDLKPIKARAKSILKASKL